MNAVVWHGAQRKVNPNHLSELEGLADLKRDNRYVSKCNPAIPRWIEMAMKVLKLPGGEGGLREAYRMSAVSFNGLPRAYRAWVWWKSTRWRGQRGCACARAV